MGRKRKPTKLKLLHGNPGKRPLPKDEPEPTAGRPDPGDLEGEALEEWERLVVELEDMGVLTVADRGILTVAAESWAEWKAAARMVRELGHAVPTMEGGVKSNPAVSAGNQARARYQSALQELGLTPATRSKVRKLDAEGPVEEKKASGRFKW